MIADCKYFKVSGETEDFVTIRLNIDVEFKGTLIYVLLGQKMADFAQFLLDEYGLAQVGHGGSSLICRKVKENA